MRGNAVLDISNSVFKLHDYSPDMLTGRNFTFLIL